MRFLILSDIHSNLEALESVMQRAEGEYDRVICCGDVIGYGPNPNEVTEHVRAMDPLIVRGNHEKAALGLIDLSLFNPLARKAALWTQRVLTAENSKYLRKIPPGPIDENEFTISHGSLLDEDEYLVDLDEAQQSLQKASYSVTFFGHTHIQGGFVLFKDGRAGLLNPEIKKGMNEGQLHISPQNRYLINPGSVGQPRDYDARAAFVIYDQKESVVRYFRVDYPIEITQEKMRKAELPHYLIDRLVLGR
jgi:predicted phosphodiesterase